MGGSLAVIRVLDIIQDMGASYLGTVSTSRIEPALGKLGQRGQVLLEAGSSHCKT